MLKIAKIMQKITIKCKNCEFLVKNMNMAMLLIKYSKYNVNYHMPTKTLYIHKAMLVKDLYRMKYDIKIHNLKVDNIIIKS